MSRITHRIFFITLFCIGSVGFVFAFIYQLIPEIESIIAWVVPMGMGLLIIGGTGMAITSKYQMRRKLRINDELGDEELSDDGFRGSQLTDYLTSPEQATTVYMLFMVGVLLNIWGFMMLVNWIRSIF
ncbi:MAG: hypothetical protein JW776_13905 [Candidatus Lokiarchaeota archaeon]|nr:hypothetical protein [Candidatus Lokiarchaeota archaeon]